MLIRKVDSEDLTLMEALKKCKESTQKGYIMAKNNLTKTSFTIKEATEQLNASLEVQMQGGAITEGIVEQLRGQLVNVVDELEKLQKMIEVNMEERKKRKARFSITLFGRTMAGKSTLMEILTKGDGKSIGKGSQRTTRDVRDYNWNGLEVTDVPGVAAFEGEEDEELAFRAAEQADLILFLITDDSPQPVEAECFARIKKLGKPVIGICNVKTALNDYDDIRLFLRSPDKSFNNVRLREILNQFQTLSDSYLPGKRTHFVVTNLRSKFLSEREEFADFKNKLLEASRFHDVESRIVHEVIGRGSFLRTKSFVDGVVTPMLDMINIFLDFSAQNSSSGRVLVGKRRQFQTWSYQFKESGYQRINALVTRLMEGLRNDVSDFVEDHYDDKNAGAMWDKHIKSTGVNEKLTKFQRSLVEDCKKALSEVSRELKKELLYVSKFANDRDISMKGIFDTKRWWNWGTLGISGGLGVAAIIIGSGPLAWGAAAVGGIGWLVSLFLEDREKKAKKNREKLSEKLHENIDKMENKLRRELTNWFETDLINSQVNVLLNDFGVVTSNLFELADLQRDLSWTLNDRQKEMNMNLLNEALKQVDGIGLASNIKDIARVPGSAMIFLIEPNFHFPQKTKQLLERLLDEKIWFVIDTGNQKSILSQAIGRGCDRNNIRMEEKLKVANVPLEELDLQTLIRVKLAQQVTGLHVMQI
ncbi:hypothetical protein A6P54_02565 [Bacillus sp. MKU004]|nr:hypothetical protein A6P54_02565 [Bacillus sp. MKU004]